MPKKYQQDSQAELNHRLATLAMLPASAKLIAGKRPKALNALLL